METEGPGTAEVKRVEVKRIAGLARIYNLYHRLKNLKVSWITAEPLTGKKNMISLVNRDSQIIFSTNQDKMGKADVIMI